MRDSVPGHGGVIGELWKQELFVPGMNTIAWCPEMLVIVEMSTWNSV